MALSEKDVSEILALHDGGKGESITSLAKAYDVSPAAIRYHVNKPASEPVSLDNTASDDDLGIGQEDPGAAIAALMANPALQALIDQAVTARLAEMGAQAAPQASAPSQGDTFAAFTQTIKHLIDTQAMQQPGYIKPLPSEQIERRLAGKVEMEALLRRYQEAGTAPLYAVGERGFFECTNAIELSEGQKLRTYLPPCEDFEPLNEAAEKVHAAMMQWIGGPSPEIGERVKQAQLDAKQAPLIGSAPSPVVDPRRGMIEVVDEPHSAPERKSVKRRDMGTIVTEAVDISLTNKIPLSAAATAGGAPVGPFASV